MLALQLLHCAQACRALRTIVGSEECAGAWRKCCRDEFGLSEPSSPPRLAATPCASFRAAWVSWRHEFGDFHGTPEDTAILRRAARTWGEIRTWLAANAPPIAASLAPGLSRYHVARAHFPGARPGGLARGWLGRACVRACGLRMTVWTRVQGGVGRARPAGSSPCGCPRHLPRTQRTAFRGEPSALACVPPTTNRRARTPPKAPCGA